MRIIFAILTLLTATPSFAEEVSVRFGIIEISERIGPTNFRFGFVKEANFVPLLTMEQGGLYGVEYSAPESFKYKVQVRAILPPGVTEMSGDVVTTEQDKTQTVMVFQPREYKGTVVEPFLFTSGDPEGSYKLEVSVNGKLFKTLEYQAYVPAAH